MAADHLDDARPFEPKDRTDSDGFMRDGAMTFNPRVQGSSP
jgi:hypothetical protein